MIKKSIFLGLLLIASIVGFINVNAINPKADFTWTPLHPSTADVVHFTDNSTYQQYIRQRMWYFGDGYGSIDKNPTHQYKKPGTYTVKLLIVWNISGQEYVDTAQKYIHVSNQPPVADAGPDQVVNTSTVTFDGSGSYDPDGNITSWTWFFGDNSTGHGKIAHHTYSNDGEYMVTLNVTDDYGAFDTDTCNVTVDTHPPKTTINITGKKGDNGWYTGNVTIKLQAHDNLTGVKKIYYRINNATWKEYSSQFKISKEGKHFVEYYSIDEALNKEKVKNVTIKIDKTKPKVDIVTPREKRLYIFGRDVFPTFRMTIIIGKITVLANASDNISGIAKVSFLVDNEEKINFTKPPYEWKWGGDIGRRTLKVVAYDKAGLSNSKEMDVKIYSLFKPKQSAEKLA